MNQGKNIFNSQISAVLAKHHNLKIKTTDSGQQYLKGTLDVIIDNENYRKSFLVEILCPEEYPYRFPILKEVGGLIPISADWHKYSDDRCCITVLPNEIVRCKDGIKLLDFIDKYAIPYLANQCHKIEFGNYLNEYSHGEKGLYEYYFELLQTKDKSVWLLSFRAAYENGKPEVNSRCFCGSNLPYLSCHKNAIDALKIIGPNLVIQHMTAISQINE